MALLGMSNITVKSEHDERLLGWVVEASLMVSPIATMVQP